MVTLANGGAWLVNGAEIIADGPKAQAELAAKTGLPPRRLFFLTASAFLSVKVPVMLFRLFPPRPAHRFLLFQT